MKISQNKNKIYVKSLNQLEHDILSTVKRYMELANDSQVTVNNIASEVMVRVKEEMAASGLLPPEDDIIE